MDIIKYFNESLSNEDTFVFHGKGGGSSGGKGGGGPSATQRTAQEAPNSLQSSAKAKFIDLLCEGPIKRLRRGAESIFADETQLVDPDGATNFKGFWWTLRRGTPDQTHVPGFAQVESEISVQARVKKSLPITRTVNSQYADFLKVSVRFPSLVEQNTVNGDLLDTTVQIAFDVKPNGGTWIEAVNDTIVGKNTSEFGKQYKFPLPAGGNPWDVRMRRVTDDAVSAAINNQCFWQSYTEVLDSKFTYPHSAAIFGEVDAEQFAGRVPSRGYEIDALMIRIPSNYDPYTREYDGFWDGTFKTDWTNNPAWCVYDMIVNNRYGLGEYVKASYLNKWSFYDIARRCDQLISDGKGGFEPRFTFNGVLNTRREAYQVLNAMVSVFWGMIYWSAGEAMITCDQPLTIKKIVTPANVIGGSFTYVGSSKKARHNSALVTWNNPLDFGKGTPTMFTEPEAIRKQGWNETDVAAFACNRESQAVRLGAWTVITEQKEKETVTYRAGLDHGPLRPGMLVGIMDPAKAGVANGGRIKSATTSRMELDREVEITEGDTYVSFETPNLDVITVKISNDLGMALELVFEEPVHVLNVAKVNAMWVLHTAMVVPRPFRVLAIRDLNNAQYEVTASFRHVNKFDEIEDRLSIKPIPSYTQIPRGVIPPPTDLLVSETLFKMNNMVRNRITISWTDSGDQRVTGYEVEAQRLGDIWKRLAFSSTGSAEILDLEPALYKFRVFGISIAGVTTKTMTPDWIAILGKTAPPGDVAGLIADMYIDGAQLSWDPVVDLDLTGYEIRRGPVGVTWDEAAFVSLTRTNTAFIHVDVLDPVDILIRAVDEIPNLSINTARVTIQVIRPDDLEFFVVVPFASYIRASWTPLEVAHGGAIEYEIRVGPTWNVGTVIGRYSGDFAEFMFPGEATETFWIKARTLAGRYSTNARFATAETSVSENRNYVTQYDAKAALWPDVVYNMTPDGGNDLVVDLIPGNVQSVGGYFKLIDLGQQMRARVWLDLGPTLKAAAPLTWATATFAWNSPEAQNPWVPSPDAQFTVTKKIYLDMAAVPYGLNEGFSLNQTLNGYVNSTIFVAFGAQYSIAKYVYGLNATINTFVGWTSVNFQEEFAISFRIRIDAPPTTNQIYMCLRNDISIVPPVSPLILARASAVDLRMPWRIPSIVPDGAFSAGDRRAISTMYAGDATPIVMPDLRRSSAVDPRMPWRMPAIVPDGVMTIEDRRTAATMYAGASAVPVPGPTPSVGDWILVGYDAVTDQFYCLDNLGFRINLTLTVTEDGDFLFLCLSQSATDRILYMRSDISLVESYGQSSFAPVGVFTRLFLFDGRSY